MKHTVETLKAEGFKGYQRNTLTGNTLEARHPLDTIAWALNNAPHTAITTYDDIGKKVRIFYENKDHWTPPTIYERFIERDMNEAEIADAEKRLEQMGVEVRQCRSNVF